MATIAVLFVVVMASIYLVACWYLVRVMLTIERKPEDATPMELGFPDAEEVSFITNDHVSLNGWFVPSTSDKVIVLVHGIYSNAWDCQAPDIVRAYQDEGLNVFLYDSRGQGRSGGTLGLAWEERHDVRAAVDLMLSRGFRSGAIGVHGSSYGAATTILAATSIPELGAIVADSSFADVRDVMLGEVVRRTILTEGCAQLLSPGLGFMVQRRLGTDLDEISPEKSIAAIAPRPVLLLHGEIDPIIPVRSVQRLASAAGPNVTVWILPERKHTEGARLTPNCEEPSPTQSTFLLRLTEFFQQHLREGSSQK